jgi:hypothetical protein
MTPTNPDRIPPFQIGERVWTKRDKQKGTVVYVKLPSYPGASWKITVKFDQPDDGEWETWEQELYHQTLERIPS